jgi:hypothetical protein
MLTGTYIPVPYCIIITNSVPNPIFPHLIHKILCLPVPGTGTVLYNNNEQRSESDFFSPNTYELLLTGTYIPVPYHCIIGTGI